MAESKIDLTDRLRREGREEEASVYRDQVRKRVRAQGKTKAEAGELAWEATAAKFPPLPDVEQAQVGEDGDVEDFDVDILLKRFDGNRPDLAEDVLWAYEHLGNPKAKPMNATSLGAWSMRQWARRNRDRFFQQLVPRALAAQTKRREEETTDNEVRAASERDIKQIDDLLSDVQRQFEQNLAEDVPRTVKGTIRSRLVDWSRRFQVNPSPDATESLTMQMAGVVGDCIAAAVANPDAFRVEQGCQDKSQSD